MNRAPRYHYPRFRKRIISGMRHEDKALPLEERKSFFQRNNIDIAILVALLTAISYGIAYCYKLGEFIIKYPLN